MKFNYKLIICYLILTCFTVNASANCDLNDTSMVILGANCDVSTQSGAPMSADPFGSDFVEMVENGECTGIVYADVPMPECAAGAIIGADPTETYFIHRYLNRDDGYGGYDGSVDEDTLETIAVEIVNGGTLETIIVEALPGDNLFSIPWYWVKSNPDDDNQSILDFLNPDPPPPYCNSNETDTSQPFTEIS